MKKKGLILLLLLLISFVSTFNVYSFSERDIKEYKMIENILLIGLDGTNDKLPKRYDTMIILTIDKLNKSLKLTSLARDTLVKIPGRVRTNSALEDCVTSKLYICIITCEEIR